MLRRGNRFIDTVSTRPGGFRLGENGAFGFVMMHRFGSGNEIIVRLLPVERSAQAQTKLVRIERGSLVVSVSVSVSVLDFWLVGGEPEGESFTSGRIS